ncbi:unnamed protein product [Scytosiphon promiscuus]
MSSEAAAAAALAPAPAEPAETKVGVRSRTSIEVWHVRHGERCDEVRGAERQAWKRSTRYKRGGWFDPFLTRYGHVQASRAGLYLNSLDFQQQQQQPESFGIVYTSPLVRAVQTAVCVSKGLGNLPLQVVPGLCSCTAAMRQIGYRSAQATLMTDDDIIKMFPGVNLVPRDPLAPTSFGGAADWLASRAREKQVSDGDVERCSRVLAVGHREGTKALAGGKVPTPHCCIGVFRVETSGVACTYKLRELLSRTGQSLRRSGEGSLYARPSTAAVGEESCARRSGNEGAVEALAAKVIELTLAEAGPESSPAESRRSQQVARIRRENNSGANSTRVGPQGATMIRSTAGGSARDEVLLDSQVRISSSTTVGLVRRLRVASSSSLSCSTAPTNKQPAVRVSTSGVQEASREPTEPDLAARRSPRRAEADRTSGTASEYERDKTEQPPPPQADEVGSRNAVDAVKKKPERVVRGACGVGSRVVARHPPRRSSVGASSTCAGILGVPVDTLRGASGILSFLSPADLCAAQTTCKPVAIAAVSESLWVELYSRLPEDLRDRSEQGKPLAGHAETAPGAATTRVHAKVLFGRALSAASSAHAARVAQKVEALQRRFPLILNLRRCVDATRAMVKVRVNGEPVRVIQTTRARADAWVSRSNLLHEPSVNRNDGVRRFSLSNSLKVEVPADFETVEALRSLRVALSWPDKDKNASLIPPMTILRIDARPFLSEARPLGNSAGNALALYDVSGKSCHGHADRIFSPPPPPVLRGCVLLGVLPAHRQNVRGNSTADAGGVGFLSVHFPHDLLLNVATRRPSRGVQGPPDDSGSPENGLAGLTAAFGLRTAGVPLWETASTHVDGFLRSPRNGVVGRRHPPKSGKPAAGVVCIDLLREARNQSTPLAGGLVATATSLSERTLSAPPGLPYSTPGGLTGVVADVLLADFTLCDPDCATLWAFTSPIVFETCLPGRAADEERRCGVVTEPGVGRVVVHLALVETPGDDRDATGQVWIVRSARAELELDFVDACFGTKYGRALRNDGA